MIAQRDDAEKRVSTLASENDELKDLVEELRDRLSNYKVQSQAKEVSTVCGNDKIHCLSWNYVNYNNYPMNAINFGCEFYAHYMRGRGPLTDVSKLYLGIFLTVCISCILVFTYYMV